MKKAKLKIPSGYNKLTLAQRKKICNGCGTSGWKGKLVPETMWGLNVSEACQIHDFMYHVGKTIGDKNTADKVFLFNLNRIIDTTSGMNSWLNPLRRIRANTYYEAVKKFGKDAFLEGKKGTKK